MVTVAGASPTSTVIETFSSWSIRIRYSLSLAGAAAADGGAAAGGGDAAAGGGGAAAAGGGAREAVRFGHPSGTLRVGAAAAQENGQWVVKKAIMGRSARVLMEGFVRVPADTF